MRVEAGTGGIRRGYLVCRIWLARLSDRLSQPRLERLVGEARQEPRLADSLLGLGMGVPARNARLGQVATADSRIVRAHQHAAGARWVHLPEKYGNWRGVYNRLRMWAVDGTWGRVFTALMAQADADEDLSWVVPPRDRPMAWSSGSPAGPPFPAGVLLL